MGKRKLYGPVLADGFEPIGTFGLRMEVDSTAGTTATNFKNHGVTMFGSTAAKQYTMDAPEPGVAKVLFCTGGSTASQNVNLASGTFDGTNDRAVFDAAGEALILIGATTARYLIGVNTGTVSFATST